MTNIKPGYVHSWVPGIGTSDCATNCANRPGTAVRLLIDFASHMIRTHDPGGFSNQEFWKRLIKGLTKDATTCSFVASRSAEWCTSCMLRLICSHQLVGTVLILLVKAELTGVIRNVEATTRKVSLVTINVNALTSLTPDRLAFGECRGTKEL